MSLKNRRLDAHMTQRQVAKCVGVSESAVCLWENGKRTPSVYKLKLLASLFRCSMDDLMREVTAHGA